MTQNTRLIPLTQGLHAIVDAADYEWLMQWKWCSMRGIYAKRAQIVEGMHKTIMMHRAIAEPRDGFAVDHINHNGLDNRRHNLREATYSQNNQHSRSKGGTSEFVGVSFCNTRRKWVSTICTVYVKKTIGRFNTEIEAATAYDSAARRLHGEFATLNFP